jgi:pSer/pThr/pTyr-binding forkhead associated (FHA) protein
LAGDPVGAKVLSLATPFVNIPATMNPPQPGFGRLVAITKSGADGESFALLDGIDIGRTEGQIVVAEDPYLSPRHARIVRTGGKFVLRDLGSTNGVYLRLAPSRDANAMSRKNEGEKVPSPTGTSPCEVAVPLRDQDLILVGQQVLKFEVTPQATVGYGPASEHGTLLFGSPASPRYARLCQRSVEGITLDVHYIQKMETVLGRESGDLVFMEDPFLSRRHAAVRLVEKNGSALTAGTVPTTPISFALVDLGSSNGTFLRVRQDVDLCSGDQFRVGQQLFRVDLEPVEHGEHGNVAERS